MVASDLVRSSKKKAAASKRQRTQVTASIRASEGEQFDESLELHRKTLLAVYGQALGDGWAPRDIGLDWLVPELRHALQEWYDDDAFRIVYDGEFAPGMMAAAQQQYTATEPTREVMRESWPVPETGAQVDPGMVAQVMSTVRKEAKHVRFTEDDSDDGSAY